MVINRLIILSVFIYSTFSLVSPCLASSDINHKHNEHGNSIEELKLNDGKRWKTDEALRKGVQEIHNILKSSTDNKDKKIDRQIDFIVSKCKLPEEADEQLHLILAEIIEGKTMLSNSKAHTQNKGKEKISRALDVYLEYFEHPNWDR
jgi:hypothetical protein